MCRVILVLGTLLTIPLGASLNGQETRPIESTTGPIGSTTRPIESELVSRIDSLSVILDRAVYAARVARAVRNEERHANEERGGSAIEEVVPDTRLDWIEKVAREPAQV